VASYPGFYAVPGSMFPGSAWPGVPPGAGADQYAIFTGGEALTYPQYLDVRAQHTLVAQPGREYDVELASGYPGPPAAIPDDGRWIPEGN
jgi:hypothetical protein